MTTVDRTRPSAAGVGATVDLAGTAWPLYKLEALAVGLLVFLAVLITTQVLQSAVLAAAGVSVVTWWVRRTHRSGTKA